MSNAPKKLVGFLNPDDVEQPGRGSGDFITSIPGPDKPITCKLVMNPEQGKGGYLPMRAFGHQIGPADEDKRFHPCATFFGEKTSPEQDALKAAYDAKDKLMTSGANRDSPEVKKQEAIIEKFKAKNFGWLYIVEPGSPKVRCVKIGQAVINTLFGRKGNDFVKEVPSLVKELISKGLNPYDLTKEEGWLTFYKIGKGLSTEYVLKLAEQEVEVVNNGKKLKAMEPVTHKVNDKISELTTDDLPDPVTFEKRNAWTIEESKLYVASGGTEVPARFLKGADNSPSASQLPSLIVGPAKLVDNKAPTATVSLDDAPF